MKNNVAIVGAGVSGLTCAVLFSERKWRTAIFAEEIGQQTTSAAAAAIWFPYDAEPLEAVVEWALETYRVLIDLSRDPSNGVSLIELRTFSRIGKIAIPEWAILLGARPLPSSLGEMPAAFTNGFAMKVPLMDTTIYLDYLARRFVSAGGEIYGNVCFKNLHDVDRAFDLIINCSGMGAKILVPDPGLEPHRGQVAIVPKIDMPYAVVCDDAPLTYSIPRANDCVFGGTNELSEQRATDPGATSRIVSECSRILNLSPPRVLAERVGIRPFRRSGVYVERGELIDGRTVVHNYGHGGCGFTLSWGCAARVLELAGAAQSR